MIPESIRIAETRMIGWGFAAYPLKLRDANKIYDSWRGQDILALLTKVSTIIDPAAKVLLKIESLDKGKNRLENGYTDGYIWPYCIQTPRGSGESAYFLLAFPAFNKNSMDRSIALFANGAKSIDEDNKIAMKLFKAMKRA